MIKQPVILSYPGAMQSAVLGMQDMLSFAGLSPVIVRAPEEMPERTPAILLPPAADRPRPDGADWILQSLKDHAARGGLICSACVGIVWVAAAGLDRGRAVTTHWGIGGDIRKDWPDLVLDTDHLVIEYTDLVTAGGLMAWIDLSLIAIERLAGQQAMLETARHFVVDPGRRDQRRFRRFQPVLDHGDTRILRAQQSLEKDLAARKSVAELAQGVNLSPRSFQRRFSKATGLSLTEYARHLRVEHAKTLLADTDVSVAEIAARVGYADVPAFHRVFLNVAGLPPATFRNSVRKH